MSQVTVQQAFELALQHHQARRLGEAEALYRQILAVQPQHAGALHYLGLVAHQTGQHDRAVEWIRQAIALAPDYAAAYSNLGEVHRALKRLEEAAAAYRQALALRPDYPEAYSNFGIILAAQGKPREAIAAYRHALELKPDYAQAYNNLGLALSGLDQLEEAIGAYHRAITLQPDYAEAYGNLGIALKRRGHFEEAATAYRRALQLKPDYAFAYNNLGLLLAGQGEFGEAIAAYRQALALQSGYAGARVNLGNALAESGQLEEAAATLSRAVQIAPEFPQAHLSLGNALVRLGQVDAAITAYQRALELQPGFAEAYNNLGVALTGKGQLDEAVAAHRRALQLKPDYTDASNNLGNALKDLGELDEAFAAYRQSLAVQPDQADVHSNLIFALHFDPGHTDQTIAEEHQRWNDQFAQPRRRFWQPPANDRNPERCLRIGYVSPDFRFHAAAFFIAPLLEAHDRERYRIHCYANVEQADAVTERLRKFADDWRDVGALSESQFAERVRSDGIDILVDLAMHTAGNRLPALARRPAPVQVSWLGYPGSTGMEAIGYRLTDAYIDPPDHEDSGLGGEVVRLPDSWCCYLPIQEFPPVGSLPAARTGCVTFGSLNQFGKISSELLRCWARLLKAAPESRILMICPEGQARERIQVLFATEGIGRERLELVAHCLWPEYTRLLERIDVALDTYPCNGMTTTCHALWMGVPVVTRMGTTAVSRAGESLLHTTGLREWIAQSEEEYTGIAVKWARDLPRLAELRGTLRARMQASPLMDAPRFARNIEGAYRAMWRRWCAEEWKR